MILYLSIFFYQKYLILTISLLIVMTAIDIKKKLSKELGLYVFITL